MHQTLDILTSRSPLLPATHLQCYLHNVSGSATVRLIPFISHSELYGASLRTCGAPGTSSNSNNDQALKPHSNPAHIILQMEKLRHKEAKQSLSHQTCSSVRTKF